MRGISGATQGGAGQVGAKGGETKICKQLKKRIKPQFVSPGNELPMARQAGGTVRSERGFGESQPQQRSPFHERERLGSWFGTQTLSSHGKRVLPIFPP